MDIINTLFADSYTTFGVSVTTIISIIIAIIVDLDN